MLDTVSSAAEFIWHNLLMLLSSGRTSSAVRNGAGAFVVRVSATLLAFVMNVTLARISGVDYYGRFVFLLAGLNVLLIPACLGFDKLSVREAARDQSRGDLWLTRLRLQRALRPVLGVSLLLDCTRRIRIICGAGAPISGHGDGLVFVHNSDTGHGGRTAAAGASPGLECSCV